MRNAKLSWFVKIKICLRMSINNKKLNRTSKVIHFSISVLVGFLLSALATKIIDDMDQGKPAPSLYKFQEEEGIESLQNRKHLFDLQQKTAKTALDSTQDQLKLVDQDIEGIKKSFENWVETNVNVSSESTDKDIVKEKALYLDSLYAAKQSLAKSITSQKGELKKLKEQENRVDDQIANLKTVARQKYNEAYESYSIEIFLWRLLFAMPLLGLSVFLVIKKRKHKYWPIFRGVIFFGLYVFFVGLLPYMPSFGGYIRYIVGIILTIGLGIYAINQLAKYMKRRKEELAVSVQERTKNLKTEEAEKALNNHNCPSCGKDFMLQDIEVKANGEVKEGSKISKNCRHCGLELFKKCGNCSITVYAHFPFCHSCGNEHDKMQIKIAE